MTESTAGTEPPDDAGGELRFSVPDMDCASCAAKVESAVDGVDGVADVDTRPTTGTVVVRVREAVAESTVVAAIERAGYSVPAADADGEGDGPANVWTSPRAIATGIGAAALFAGLLIEFGVVGIEATVATVLGAPIGVADVLFLAAVALAGREIVRGGLYSARNVSLDIDFLMTVAIVAAISATLLSPEASLFSEAATLAVLFSTAELLEEHSMDQARSSLRELMDLSPDEATVRRDGEEVTVPVDELSIGDRVVIPPGEKIPADGTVVEGASAVDESPITGESVPADKAVGDEVYAGTINEEGYLEVEVEAEPGDDTLSQIVRLVEDAEADKTEREQFVDRFSGYYTPLMVAVAVGVATIPPLAFGADWITWFVYGITMLVLACPCAFVISTPVTVVSGITSAAKNGVLIKGGDRLEAMGQVDAVALDKTGTITRGELSVTDVIPIGDRDEEDVLRCARGLEERSEHPIGEAIVAHADQRAVEGTEVGEFESLTGEGVRATLAGDPHYAGNPDLFEDLGFDLGRVHVLDGGDDLAAEVHHACERQGCLDLVEDAIPRLREAGKTVVLVGREDELEGVIAVADEVRPGAAWTVQRLSELGVETVMLTGDEERTARAIADEVGIDQVRAGLLPDEKVDAVEGLLEEYPDGVAMVGDGVNDAPALATATVGVAMGAAGTDAAIETADVALMADDVTKLPYLSELARDANGIIRQNVWASLGMKALLAVGVPLGYVSVAVAVLLGDAGMTVGVTGNAMRLSQVQPEEADDEPAAA
ncbi:heavy metal translocating P-type ATPase [Halomicrobium salinisoli]|uniref:heavy metal translocating P-type ATPase n=1 Tax=Halomicrobium salinisoli TaxID=2878391 RepID=UPI001CF048A4|nr:cation-translocating P-type ATPase [Halomicrobium salinisoli]